MNDSEQPGEQRLESRPIGESAGAGSGSGSLPWLREGRQLVTVSRKCNAVSSLSAYWNIKGILVRMKMFPELLDDMSMLSSVADYLDNHTKLPTTMFWNKMTRDQKLRACKRLICMEDVTNISLPIFATPKNAELFIVLSGDATTRVGETEHKFGHGELFGYVEQFEKVFDKDAKSAFMLSSGNRSLEPVRLNRCSYIRLGYGDLLNFVLFPPVAIEAGPGEKVLTPEEELCLRADACAKKALPSELYEFLKKNNIIAESPSSPSFEYIHVGNINREVVLNKSHCTKAFILLDGTIKFEINKDNGTSKTVKASQLICRQKGDKSSLSIKRTVMPLILMSNGSLFAIQEECFNVGKVVEQLKPLPVARRVSKKQIKIINNDLYSLRMIFERDSIYLSVPMETIRSALRTLASSAPLYRDIRLQLSQTNASILERINFFLPWINGDISWNLPTLSASTGPQLPPPNSFSQNSSSSSSLAINNMRLDLGTNLPKVYP